MSESLAAVRGYTAVPFTTTLARSRLLSDVIVRLSADWKEVDYFSDET